MTNQTERKDKELRELKEEEMQDVHGGAGIEDEIPFKKPEEKNQYEYHIYTNDIKK